MAQMGNPIERLKQNMPNLTKAQKNVAEYIIQERFDTAFSTIDQVATSVGTSTTTIMRLMSVIGYSGYAEFQKELQQYLKEHMSPKVRLDANLQNIGQNDLWTQCFQKQIDNVMQTMENIPYETLDQVISRVASARTVFLGAARGGSMVAQFLHLFISRMFGNTVLFHTDTVAEWASRIPNVNDSDVAIIISYPRYSKTVRQFARALKERGAFIVGITDSYSAPLAQCADILLPCSCGSIGFHNSPVSAMMLADCLINVMSLRYSSIVRERLEISEKVLDSFDFYDNI